MESIEITKYNKDFGVYLVINTSECEEWCGNPDPMVFVVKSAEDFMNLGIEVATDGRPYTELNVGEKVADIDFGGEYEGVYIMRVA